MNRSESESGSIDGNETLSFLKEIRTPQEILMEDIEIIGELTEKLFHSIRRKLQGIMDRYDHFMGM